MLPSSPVAVVGFVYAAACSRGWYSPWRRPQLRCCGTTPMQPTILVAGCSLKMHSRVTYNQNTSTDNSKTNTPWKQKNENGASVPAKNSHRGGTKNMKHRFQQKHDMVEVKIDTGCSKIKTPIAKKKGCVQQNPKTVVANNGDGCSKNKLVAAPPSGRGHHRRAMVTTAVRWPPTGCSKSGHGW